MQTFWEILGDPTATVALVGLIIGTCSFGAGLYQYRKAQKWVRLRFLSEQVEKLYSDDALCLSMKFLEWHDRDIILPEKYSKISENEKPFQHRIKNMKDAMSVNNRIYDPETGVYDLKEEYRIPKYTIYVEVFDRFFDFLSEVQIFKKENLIEDYRVFPVEYIVQRMDALQIFDGYINVYQLDDIKELIESFRPKKRRVLWVNGALWATWRRRVFPN